MQNVGACDMFTDDRPEGIAVGVLPSVKQPGREVGDQPDGKDLEDKQGESHGRSSMQVATRLPESRKRNHTPRDAGAQSIKCSVAPIAPSHAALKNWLLPRNGAIRTRCSSAYDRRAPDDRCYRQYDRAAAQRTRRRCVDLPQRSRAGVGTRPLARAHATDSRSSRRAGWRRIAAHHAEK